MGHPLLAQAPVRRRGQVPPGRPRPPVDLRPALRHAASTAGASSEAEAEKVVRTLSERATAAQAEAVWAGGTVPIAGSGKPGQTAAVAGLDATQAVVETIGSGGWLQPVRSTWSWPAIAALVIPALILLVVWLA